MKVETVKIVLKQTFGEKMDNYRELWKYITKTEIPKGYAIHHLNFKHADSRVGNIIALPLELHTKFHNIVRNTKDKTQLYYAILNLEFDKSYIKYMKRIDKKLT